MKQKKRYMGLKLPNGELIKLVFLSKSSLGVVYGVPHSEKHITVIKKKGIVSSHETIQEIEKTYTPIGQLIIKDISEESFWNNVFKPKKLENSDLDKKGVYFTKKYILFINRLSEVPMKRKQTKNEIIEYIDLHEIFSRAAEFVNELGFSPEPLVGICTLREILNFEEIEFFIVDKKKAVIKVDNELFEIDISVFQNPFGIGSPPESENPLQRILKPLGFLALAQEIEKKFEEEIFNHQVLSKLKGLK